MNRFSSFNNDELETIIDALMFDRLDLKGLGEKLLDEAINIHSKKPLEKSV